MAEMIKRINRTLKSKGSITEYYTDTMSLPDGSTAQWDFVKHKGAAAVIPVLPDGRIIMVRQYRNALERFTLEIPAGGLNILPDGSIENTQLAAHRELEEETGYRAKEFSLLISIYTTVAFCNEKIDIYLARQLYPTQQHLDPDEYLDVEIHELSELERMIYDCKIQDSKTIAAIMSYKNLLATNRLP